MSKFSPALAAAIAGAAGLVGQAAAEPIDRGALEALFDEPVTTSSTGAPQRVTDAPVNMTIISQNDIRRSGAIDLPGVLARLANVDTMRTSAGQADVSIRGYNSTLSPRLLVLLNGRQVYLDDYGRTNWDLIPVQLGEIRQIEVVTGPNTALFGFNALAGVINIITFDPLYDDTNQVMVRGGSRGYAGGSAIATTRLGENLGLRLSLGGYNSDTLPGDDAVAHAFTDVNGQPTESANPQARSFAINAAYALSDRVRADFEATWARNERTDRFTQSVFATPYETNSFKAVLSADTDFGLWQAQLYSNSLDYDIRNRVTVGSVSLVTKLTPAQTLRVAGEARHNVFEQNGGHVIYDVQSLSGMWNWQANTALALTTAARLDALELGRSGSFVSPNFPFTNRDYDQSFTEWSFNVGGVYRLSPSDALRVSGARGIGSPSLSEYGYQLNAPAPPGVEALIAGDPHTAPTIVYNIELGWDHEAPAIGGRIRAALFWQKNEDLRVFASRLEILSVFPTVVTALLPQQIGESEMEGVELGVDGQSGRVHWNAQYSWRHIEDSLTVPPLVAQAAYQQTSPEHVATAGVTWVGDRFEAGVDARYTSETLQFGRGTALTGLFPVDAYVQANARLAWNASETVQLELSGRNLLEAQTQTVGLTPVERSVYLTLRAGF